MHPFIKKLNSLNFTTLRFYSAGLCALLIILSLLKSEPLNPDGLLYMQATQSYLHSGLKASMAVFPWPFITLTLAYTHQLTHLTLEHSAYLLNIILAMLFVGSFITLIKKLEINYLTHRPFLFLSAGLLLALYPELNRTAALITRDIGYWAFTTLALIQLLNHIKQPTWKNALAFGCFQLIATLYRSEGLIFLLFLPFSLFFTPYFPHRFFNFLRCQSITMGLGLLAFLFLQFQKNSLDIDIVNHAERLIDPLIHITKAWGNNWSKKIHIINTYVLEPAAKDSGFLLLLGGSIFVFLQAIIKAISFFYFLLCLYGIKISTFYKTSHRALLTTFFILNFLITAGFTAQHQFLPTRYAVPLCFIFLIFAVKGLEAVLSSRSFYLKTITLLLLFLTLLGDAFHTGPSKHYFIEAGHWLKQQQTKTIFSNKPQIIYYADRTFDYKHNPYTDEALTKLITKKQLSHYDYIALYLSKNDLPPAPFYKSNAIVNFTNQRGDGVWIFKTQKTLFKKAVTKKNHKKTIAKH